MNQVQVHEFMWSSYGVQYIHEQNLVATLDAIDASCEDSGTATFTATCGTGAHPGGRLSLHAVSIVLWHTRSRDLEPLLKGSDSQVNLGVYYEASAAAPMPLFFRYDEAHAAELKSVYDTCEDVPNLALSNSLLNASKTYSCAYFARQCMDPLPGKTWGRVKPYKDPTTGAEYDYTQDTNGTDGTEVTCGCCRCKHLHGGGCSDTTDWFDSQGDGCSSYEASCEQSDLYAVGGIGANEACCVCGGGTQPVCDA